MLGGGNGPPKNFCNPRRPWNQTLGSAFRVKAGKVRRGPNVRGISLGVVGCSPRTLGPRASRAGYCVCCCRAFKPKFRCETGQFCGRLRSGSGEIHVDN
jgi:hypothetical protein